MKAQFVILILVLLRGVAYGQDPQVEWLVDFDSISPVYIDTLNPDNVWQIGPPQKDLFDSAFSPPNVIVTDTLEYYPNLTQSEFIVKAPNPSGGIGMEMYHKYDTDTLLDGGEIEVSYDGIEWENIGNTTFFSWNEYDYFSNLGFNGNSGGWVNTYYYWNYPPTDTLQIKFIFRSDDIQTNKEGWMLDNIYFTFDLGIGIDEHDQNNVFTAFPNPFNHETLIQFANPENKNYKLKLFDSGGRLIKTITSIRSNQVRVDRNSLTKGVYIFQLTSDSGKTIKGQLVVE